MPLVDQRGYNHIKNRYGKKNYVKKEYCCPELSVIPVSAEPIMGTNSPFESDHKKAEDDNTNTFDVEPD